ncbi:phage tail protein [Aeromonas aquatica]|uniref:phage tail protein n=1 Tax=Aeromonas aquatica TaxID=558964 RepID=UPI00051B779E|nr:phage tail protein [Aeromonas aquatica]
MISEFADNFMRGLKASSNAYQGPSVMMDLGGLRFGISTQEYEEIRTSMSWRWAEKQRYLRTSALQFQGINTVTKTLSITVIAETSHDLEFLPVVQAMGDDGVPYRLVAGAARPVGGVTTISGGSDLGLWCITDLDITESEMMRDGTAMLYKASLTIKSYGEDRA